MIETQTLGQNGRVVISLGGSIIVPNEIDYKFLAEFKSFIEKQVNVGVKFLIICGGGATGKRYIEAAKHVVDVSDEDLDWLGIHTTRLNAHLLRTIFKEIAFPIIITHHDERFDVNEAVVVAAGSKPGWSTDYVSASLAVGNGLTDIINLSNIDLVYDKDPSIKGNEDAKPLETLKWTQLQQMVGDIWTPNLSSPFDPIATKLCFENNLKLIIANGRNIENLENMFSGKPFVGTQISN
ncbi:MAG: UMP kinase [bacterium]|nr:UMP kinase [bacterium]